MRFWISVTLNILGCAAINNVMQYTYNTKEFCMVILAGVLFNLAGRVNY